MARLRHAPPEAGFTLIEILIVTALFVVVTIAGFETLRSLGNTLSLITTRNTLYAQSRALANILRADSHSAAAIWSPAAPCANGGTSLELMKNDAAGYSFELFRFQNGQIQRAMSPNAIDPCSANDRYDTMVDQANALTVTTIPATQLAAHVDPISQNVDGGMIVTGGVSAVAADAHVVDAAGTTITSGNTIAEVTLDVSPFVTVIDLVAGNRPSTYTQVLNYQCTARCAANSTTNFPELAGLHLNTCIASANIPDGTWYAPIIDHFVDNGTGVLVPGGPIEHYVITGYDSFAFTGTDMKTVTRFWPQAVWPPANAPPLNDPYPFDPGNNSVNTIIQNGGAGQIANDLKFGDNLGGLYYQDWELCRDVANDTYFG